MPWRECFVKFNGIVPGIQCISSWFLDNKENFLVAGAFVIGVGLLAIGICRQDFNL